MCTLCVRVKYIAVHYYVLGTDNKGLTMRVARKRRGLNFCNVTVHADVPYFVSGLSKCEHHVFKHAAFPFFVTNLTRQRATWFFFENRHRQT